MTTVIYSLFTVTVLGALLSFFLFFKFLASFSSLLFTYHATARGTWDIVTGGFVSFFRVLFHPRNHDATKALFRNAVFLIVAFGLTIGAALHAIELNSTHCVFDMVQVSSDGTSTVICDTPK